MYHIGVYLAPECAAYGNYYVAYFAQQGQRAKAECIIWGGDFPLLQYLLRVTVFP
ncbi:hypothetical protein ABT097_27985 [Streptomyces sp. NPDC002225]|uniref:hypothetical protein n=1 Tax=Streptomyces sp. NPDC002225 TaxID=3154413 RepID=UPI0033209D38